MNGSSENFAANEQRPRRGATPHDACAPRDGGPQTGPETARARPGFRRIWPCALPIALSGLAVGLLLIVAGLLAVPGQVGAQGVTTLVSNLNQGNDQPLDNIVGKIAQQFTVGSAAGDYTMTGIDVDFDKGHANAVDATGKPAISVSPREDQTLTADIGTIADDNGLPDTFPDDYTFQWILVDETTDPMTETDISGATSHTYTLVAADVGKKVKVKVSFTHDGNNDNGNSYETLTSDAWPPSGSIGAPRNATGNPEILGMPLEGRTLTAQKGSLRDPDGLPEHAIKGSPPNKPSAGPLPRRLHLPVDPGGR